MSVSFSVAFVLASILGLAGCSTQPRVIIVTQTGGELPIQVEIADTPPERAQGLQYRRELSDDQGMIFLFPSESVQSFWMKDTPIALDIIFISADRKIVGIIHEAIPFSTDSLSVRTPSRFVLEIKGGLAKRKGIAAGDAVRFENVSLDRIKE